MTPTVSPAVTPEIVLGALREMSGQSTVLSEAIARHVGLSPSDLEVLGAIAQHGPLTAGQLGELTGLSAAAVTGLIDRLERAGVAVRRADSSDRRRVLVEAAQGAQPIAALYGALEKDATRVARRRDPSELAIILDFLREMHELAVKHTARLEQRQRG